MAQVTVPSLNEIQAEILSSCAEAPNLPATVVLTTDEQAILPELISTSRVSVFRQFIYVISVAIWAGWKKWQVLSDDIDARIAATRPFTKGWYKETALNYQHGRDLEETGVYDNTGLTLAQIAAEKVVAKAAVIEAISNNRGILRIKVAKLSANVLEPLSGPELTGFDAYMELMGAAGVPVVATSGVADDLKLEYKVYYDPTILNNAGERLDGSDDTPVITALKSYLIDKNSNDFNGQLSLDELNDVVESVRGVTDVFVKAAASKYGSFLYTDTNAQGTVGPFDEFRQPEAGYFKLDEVNSIFTYVAKQL